MSISSRRFWKNMLYTAVWVSFPVFALVMIYKIAVGIHF